MTISLGTYIEWKILYHFTKVTNHFYKTNPGVVCLGRLIDYYSKQDTVGECLYTLLALLNTSSTELLKMTGKFEINKKVYIYCADT